MNLTAVNTAIVLDSTADMPDGAQRFPNWRVVPLYVRFGDESFTDGVEITADAFYERLRSDPEFPRTSQPTPADFLRAYREPIEYERIYSLHISSKVSGTFTSAESAAEELGHGVVRAVDTETASGSIGLLALAIQRRLERGTTDEEIGELVERYKRERGLLFTVDTLEFLQRGGRIGKARAFAGSVLHVKPILSIVDGEVAPVKRVRGDKKAFAELVEALETQTADEPEWHLGIAHATAPERAAELETLVRERRPNAQLDLVVTLGAVIGAHAGPGTLALFWFRDVDYRAERRLSSMQPVQRLPRFVVGISLVLAIAGCRGGPGGTQPTGAASSARPCPAGPNGKLAGTCASPDGAWILTSLGPGHGLYLARRGSQHSTRMYASNVACCSYMTWSKPHLLLFEDYPAVLSLDPENRNVTSLASLSDFTVSPDGRWFAGTGSGDPEVDPSAFTVYVLSVKAPTCLVVPGQASVAGFTADGKNVIVQLPYHHGSSPLRQFALSSLKAGGPASVATTSLSRRPKNRRTTSRQLERTVGDQPPRWPLGRARECHH